jgi:tetratricopeptide (TPR) repeat protein
VKCLNNIGDVLCQQGFYQDAAPHLEKALDMCQKVGARQHLAALRLNIGHVAQSKGHYQDAIAAYHAALDECRAVGDLRHMAGAMCDIGDSYLMQECYDQALIYYEKAEMAAKEIGDIGVQGIANLGIAGALSGNGSYSRALERYGVALKIALQAEDLLQKAKTLEGMAETKFRMRNFIEARLHLRQAQDAYMIAGVQDAARVSLRLTALDARAS